MLGCSHQKPYSCVAGPNEKCPSASWYKDYQRYKALSDELHPAPKLSAEKVQQKQDEMNGIGARLSAEMQQDYAGYKWDEGKQRFVKP